VSEGLIGTKWILTRTWFLEGLGRSRDSIETGEPYWTTRTARYVLESMLFGVVWDKIRDFKYLG